MMLKLKTQLLAAAVISGCLSPATWAQTEPTHERFGGEKNTLEINRIEVQNLQGERLGRVKEVAVDLSEGRIVAVLVVSGDFLGIGGKIVEVPPPALTFDQDKKVYLLDASTAVFNSAPAVDRSMWQDTGRNHCIAAAYRLFGQAPYFLEDGVVTPEQTGWTKLPLGYVERSSRISGMSVSNLQGEKLGKVWTLTLDIPIGRIQNVIIQSVDGSKNKSVVPAMSLVFSPSRTALMLDDTKEEFADEPRYAFTAAANGNKPHSKEETYQGPRTTVALEQGDTFRDEDRTSRIKKSIRRANINARNVQIGTINGRVTLRGWVNSEGDRKTIGEIAINASRLELVDNQITVGKPVTVTAPWCLGRRFE